MEKINLEEIFNSLEEGIKNDLDDWGKYRIIQKFKEVARQTLQLAADNAEISEDYSIFGKTEFFVDKRSILDLINNIE